MMARITYYVEERRSQDRASFWLCERTVLDSGEVVRSEPVAEFVRDDVVLRFLRSQCVSRETVLVDRNSSLEEFVDHHRGKR